MENLMSKKDERCFSLHIDKCQVKDIGMVLALICLLVGYFKQQMPLIASSVFILIVNILWPNIFRPLSKIWFGFSHIVGGFVSKVILSFLFLALITPVGYTMRLFGRDQLQLKKWKKSKESVFTVRNKTFQPDDVAKPY